MPGCEAPVLERPDTGPAEQASAARRDPCGTVEGERVRPLDFLRSKSARTILYAVLMLVGCELAVRGRAWLVHGQASTQAGIYEVDAELGQVPKAGAIMTSDGATTTINRWGLRGPECTLQKPPGTVRVLCLGASTTFGQPGDDDSSIWPARLEGRLNERGLGVQVEVLNGAIPGYTMAQSLVNLERRLSRFDPDVVVVYQAASSVSAHARRQFSHRKGAGNRSSWWSPAALRDRFSLAYMLLRANTAALMAAHLPVGRHHRLDERGVKRFGDEVGAVIDGCRERGYEVATCTFPRAFDCGQPSGERHRLAQSALFFNPQLSVRGLIDAYDRYNGAIRLVAGRKGGAVIDLDRLIPRDKTHFIDSIHLSPVGHEAVAGHVASVVAPLIQSRLHGGRAGLADAVP